MTIRRKYLIPVILALSAAGTIAAGSAATTTVAQAHSVHVVARAESPTIHYWG